MAKKYLVEISDDHGNHAVAEVNSHKEATQVYNTVKSGLGAEIDNDEHLAGRDPVKASREWDNRDHDQFRVRTAPVEQPNEDLEAETDCNEAPVSKWRWW